MFCKVLHDIEFYRLKYDSLPQRHLEEQQLVKECLAWLTLWFTRGAGKYPG